MVFGSNFANIVLHITPSTIVFSGMEEKIITRWPEQISSQKREQSMLRQLLKNQPIRYLQVICFSSAEWIYGSIRQEDNQTGIRSGRGCADQISH